MTLAKRKHLNAEAWQILGVLDGKSKILHLIVPSRAL